MKQQLVLLGKVARAPDDDVLRKLTFMCGSLRPATERFVRKVGRPRQEWAVMLMKESLKFAGTFANLETMLMNETQWYQAVHKHCLQ